MCTQQARDFLRRSYFKCPSGLPEPTVHSHPNIHSEISWEKVTSVEISQEPVSRRHSGGMKGIKEGLETKNGSKGTTIKCTLTTVRLKIDLQMATDAHQWCSHCIMWRDPDILLYPPEFFTECLSQPLAATQPCCLCPSPYCRTPQFQHSVLFPFKTDPSVVQPWVSKCWSQLLYNQCWEYTIIQWKQFLS